MSVIGLNGSLRTTCPALRETLYSHIKLRFIAEQKPSAERFILNDGLRKAKGIAHKVNL